MSVDNETVINHCSHVGGRARAKCRYGYGKTLVRRSNLFLFVEGRRSGAPGPVSTGKFSSKLPPS